MVVAMRMDWKRIKLVSWRAELKAFEVGIYVGVLYATASVVLLPAFFLGVLLFGFAYFYFAFVVLGVLLIETLRAIITKKPRFGLTAFALSFQLTIWTSSFFLDWIWSALPWT